MPDQIAGGGLAVVQFTAAGSENLDPNALVSAVVTAGEGVSCQAEARTNNEEGAIEVHIDNS